MPPSIRQLPHVAASEGPPPSIDPSMGPPFPPASAGPPPPAASAGPPPPASLVPPPASPAPPPSLPAPTPPSVPPSVPASNVQLGACEQLPAVHESTVHGSPSSHQMGS